MCKIMSTIPKENLRFLWPKVFDTTDISCRTDAELVVDGLMAWVICCAGEIHPNFGDAMAQIAKRLAEQQHLSIKNNTDV